MKSIQNIHMLPLDCAEGKDECNNTVYETNLNDLPNELLLLIFCLVDYESIQSIEQVCSRWQALAMTPIIWENMKIVFSSKNYLQLRDNLLPRVASNLKLVKLQCFKSYGEIRWSLTSFCPNLTHLEITLSLLQGQIMEDLKSWPNLKFLSFRNSIIVAKIDQDQDYSFDLPFLKLKHLETLVLSNFGLTPSSLQNMVLCQNLRTVNIEKMRNIPSYFLECLISSKLHILKDLLINGDTLTDDVLTYISKCTCLETLHITTCKSLFDSSLCHLAKLTNLKSLKLRHGYFSTSALITFFSNNIFQKLVFLSLSRCLHVSMKVVQVIKTNAPKLQELSLYQCPFIMDNNFDRSEIQNLFSISLLLD